MAHAERSADVWRGIMAGALGGIVGSTAMVLFNRALAATGFGHDDLGRHAQARRVAAEPNDTDGTISDEPASIKTADLAARAAGTRLEGRERLAAGAVVHHTYGAVVGAVYGALAARFPGATVGAGAPYGALVWLASAEAGLPLAGLARRPDEYPAARHAASFGSHLAFGLTLEAVRRALTTPEARPR